jgi:hypothetical protein
MSKQIIISDDKKSVTIKELTIYSELLAETLEKQPEPGHLIVELIEIGIRARNLVDNRVDQDSVKHTVNALGERFEKQIELAVQEIAEKSEEILGGDESTAGKFLANFKTKLQSELKDNFDSSRTDSYVSKFNELLVKSLDREIQLLKEEFIVTKENSALHILSETLKRNLNEANEDLLKQFELLKTIVVGDEATKKARSKQSIKGFDLESAIHEALASYCTNFQDAIKVTGAQTGDSGNQKGDLVITLNSKDSAGQDLRIAIESKADKKSTKDIRDELYAGMENRRAVSGIAVFDASKRPTGILEDFTVFEDFCIVVVDRENVDPNILYVAYLWARWNALKHKVDANEMVPWQQIDEFIGRLRERMSSIKVIKQNHGRMNQALRLADGEIHKLESGLAYEIEEFTNRVTLNPPTKALEEDERQVLENQFEDFDNLSSTPPISERDLQMAGILRFGKVFPRSVDNQDTKWLDVLTSEQLKSIRGFFGKDAPTLHDLSSKTFGEIADLTKVGNVAITNLTKYLEENCS